MNPVTYNSTTLTFLPDSEFERKEKREAIQLDLYRPSVLFYVTEPLINGDTTGWVSQHGGEKLSGESYTKRVPMTGSQKKLKNNALLEFVLRPEMFTHVTSFISLYTIMFTITGILMKARKDL